MKVGMAISPTATTMNKQLHDAALCLAPSSLEKHAPLHSGIVLFPWLPICQQYEMACRCRPISPKDLTLKDTTTPADPCPITRYR
jgi:hypothetical protein